VTLALSIGSLLFSSSVFAFVIWNGRQIKRINAETAASIARTKTILGQAETENTP